MAVLGDRPRRRRRRARCARRSPTARRRAATSCSSTHGCRRIAANAARDVVARRHAHLALAVVAEARALDDAGQQRRVDAARRRLALRSTANGATAKPLPGEERLLADAVLRDGDACRGRRDTRASRARNSSAAAGTFSNSVVAARAQRARARASAVRIEIVGARCAGRRRCRRGCRRRDRAPRPR